MAQFRLVWLVLVICAISISTRYGGANGEPPAGKDDAVEVANTFADLLDEIREHIDGNIEVTKEMMESIKNAGSKLMEWFLKCIILPFKLMIRLVQAILLFLKVDSNKDALLKEIMNEVIASLLKVIINVFCACLGSKKDSKLEPLPDPYDINDIYDAHWIDIIRRTAKADLKEIETHMGCFDRVGTEYVVSPSVLAGLVSRMTRGGTAIENTDGYNSDNTKYGLLPCDVTASGLGEDCKGFGWNTCDQVDMVVKRVLRPKMDEIMTDDNTKDLDYYDQLKMSLEIFNYYAEVDFTNDVLVRSMFYCDPINITGIDDPHFFVPVHGSENPVCFDLYGENGQIFQLLEDKETGAVINAELTNGNQNYDKGMWMGKMTVLKDGHSVYLDSDGITVDNATKGTWEQNISLAPMAMTMDQSTVNIFDLGNDVTASVRTNAFAALDIDILIKEPTKAADIGGLIGVAIDCLESVEVEDENEAILNLCGGRKVHSDLALRRQGKTPCWLVPFDTLFVGKDFMPPCLFCAMPKGKGKGNQ